MGHWHAFGMFNTVQWWDLGYVLGLPQEAQTLEDVPTFGQLHTCPVLSFACVCLGLRAEEGAQAVRPHDSWRELDDCNGNVSHHHLAGA